MPMKTPKLGKFAKRAGILVVALLVLDFAVGTAAVAFGWHTLRS